MDYGQLLSRSWRVVWDNKFMFVLGFLAALGSGGSSNNFNFRTDGSDFQNMPFFDAPFSPPDLERFLPVIGAFAVGALCFAVILIIALWVLSLTAEGGMIDAASRLDAGQKSSFSEAMSAGWQYIWRLLGLSLLLFGFLVATILGTVLLLGLGFGASIAGAAASNGDGMAGLFAALGVGLVAVLCCLICGLILLTVVISIVYTFAQRAIVLEDYGVFESIRRAWQVIRDNTGEVIILLFLFMLLGFVVSAVIAAIFIPLGALSFGPGMFRLFSGEALSGLDIVLMVVGGLAIAVIVALIRSFFVAFKSSAFTLAFQEFTDKKLPAAEIG